MKAIDSTTRSGTGPADTNDSAAVAPLVTQTATSLAASPSAESGRKRHDRKKSLVALAATTGIALAVYGGYRWVHYVRNWEKTDNAYVASHVHTVSTRISGTVQEVFIDENQQVQFGTIIARLDPRDFEIRKQQAEAQLSQTRAQHRQAQSKVIEAQAQLAREKARAGKAKLDRQRAESLFEGGSGAISRQELDQAKAEYDAAFAALDAAQAATGSAEAQVLAAEAQEQAAQANVDDAKLQLTYTEIRAPVSGRIGKKNLEVGNRVQAGQSLLALVQPDVWITANFKETQLRKMKPGQPVQIRIDAFPDHVFSGTVESLSPATGAQFALLPPDNATGNFTKIVQRVPVKVLFKAEELASWAGRVAAGLSAVVEVEVGS